MCEIPLYSSSLRYNASSASDKQTNNCRFMSKYRKKPRYLGQSGVKFHNRIRQGICWSHLCEIQGLRQRPQQVSSALFHHVFDYREAAFCTLTHAPAHASVASQIFYHGITHTIADSRIYRAGAGVVCFTLSSNATTSSTLFRFLKCPHHGQTLVYMTFVLSYAR